MISLGKINVAVIGCGTIGSTAHIPSYHKNNEVQIKYLVDIIPEKAQAIKDKLGLDETTIITDYKKLFDDKTIDAVSVCLPNYLHSTVAIDCLNAGFNVLCEKPIAISLQEAYKMKQAADINNKILNIGVVNRFDNYSIELKKLIESGKLGEIYHICCSFRNHRSIPGMGGWFTTSCMSGGGVLIDWGVHFIDLILFVMNNPEVYTVTGKTYCKLGKNMKEYVYYNMWAGPPNYDGVYDVDDYVSAFIRTAGPTISLNGAWAQNITDEDMTIEFLGSKGGAKLRYRKDYDVTVVENGRIDSFTPKYEHNDIFASEINAFIESVKSGIKNCANIDKVIISQKILDGIYESSNKNIEISLR